jgi:hypothetical protein
VNNRSNIRVISSVAAAVIIIVLAAYVLAAVVSTTNHQPTQTSIGTIIEDALPASLSSGHFCSASDNLVASILGH